MLGKASDSSLVKIEQQTQAKIPQQYQQSYQRAIAAGVHIMYSPKGLGLMKKQFTKPGDPAFNIGEGVAKLIGIMYEQSKRTMPVQIAVPAAMFFMSEALDFLAKSGQIKLTPDFIAQTAKETGSSVLQLFGVTPDKLQALVAKHGGQPQLPPQATPQAQPAGIIGAQRGA